MGPTATNESPTGAGWLMCRIGSKIYMIVSGFRFTTLNVASVPETTPTPLPRQSTVPSHRRP